LLNFNFIMKKMPIKPVESVEELIKKLEKTCEEMELIVELTKKYRDNTVVAQMLVHKQIEDGILANLGNAKIYQLKALKNGFRFHYYDKEMVDKLINITLSKRIRKDKLNIISGSDMQV